MKFLVYFIFASLSYLPIVNADMLLDLQATYLNDQFKYATQKSNGLLLTSASINFIMNKSKSFHFGWSVFNISLTDKDDSTTNTFTSLDMGPKFLWVSKSGDYHLSVSYNVRNTTSYREGASDAVTLRGTSILAELGVLPEIAEGLCLGIKLNYYNPIWTESLVGTTTLTTVAYNRTLIIPTIALAWIF